VEHLNLDLHAYFDRARDVLSRHVAFDGCCWMSFDPATILPTSHVPWRSIKPEDVPRLAQNEYAEEDVNKFSVLAQDARRVGVLSEATAGNRGSSIRYEAILRPNGFENELRAALEHEDACWAGIAMYRKDGAPDFDQADVGAVTSVTELLAEGVRRSILTSAVSGDDEPESPGLILLDGSDRVDALSPAAQRWLDDLVVVTDEDKLGLVQAVASHARRAGRGESDDAARARVRTRSGRWLVLHGSLVDERADGRVAVIVEPARAPQIAPLIALAYGLTPRERDVARLVIQGLSTNDIAKELFVSPHTVQDHMKSIFAKIGVRSRRELVTQVFAEHYAPRLEQGTPVAADGWFSR
jgi:DNA-binding CsgD family transcriptional regulator